MPASAFSSISLESPVRVQGGKSSSQEDAGSNSGRSSSTTLALGGQFFVTDADSFVVSDTRDAANPLRFKWSRRHNEISGSWGLPRTESYPTCARLKFRGGRLGDVRCAADIPVGYAGNRGRFTASVREAALPAFVRVGALETLGGHSAFSQGISALRRQGVDIPPTLNYSGRSVLGAVSCGEERSKSEKGATNSASYSE